mmetsp:Transcript_24606/g.38991  ORF Transcript_24606/g.38991 Transcript_24606/m.38991 type:complete len:243 (+) Transcript_24606:481-1209(+)
MVTTPPRKRWGSNPPASSAEYLDSACSVMAQTTRTSPAPPSRSASSISRPMPPRFTIARCAFSSSLARLWRKTATLARARGSSASANLSAAGTAPGQAKSCSCTKPGEVDRLRSAAVQLCTKLSPRARSWGMLRLTTTSSAPCWTTCRCRPWSAVSRHSAYMSRSSSTRVVTYATPTARPRAAPPSTARSSMPSAEQITAKHFTAVRTVSSARDSCASATSTYTPSASTTASLTGRVWAMRL